MAYGNPFLAVVLKFTTVYLIFAFVPNLFLQPSASSPGSFLSRWHLICKEVSSGPCSHAPDPDFLCLVTKFTLSLVLRPKWPRPSLHAYSDIPMSVIGTDFPEVGGRVPDAFRH